MTPFLVVRGSRMNIEVAADPATEIRYSAYPTNLLAGTEDLADFAGRAEELDEALSCLADLVGEEARRSVARLKQKLSDFEPAVTVLGQVKSGKTSLINAMAGWADLLPSDVNPWTSVVTSLHLTPADEPREIGARFRFMTEGEWDRLTTKGGRIGELAGRAGADGELGKIREQITAMREKSRQRLGRHFELLMGQEHEYGYFDKNLLERYICLGDDFDDATGNPADQEQGRFADITRSAELYLNCQTVPFRMCIRDTPGVNDTFMMREMVTINAIRDSRICIVVLSAAQALTSVDMALIRMISNLRSREVVIFVNRIDELADPGEQLLEIEESIRRTLKTHGGPQDAKILFGSAYWAGKALSGELDDMTDASAEALINLTRARIRSSYIEQPATSHTWEMSGLPALMRTLSSLIVEGQGEPCLEKIAASALSLATSREAAQTIRIEGDAHDQSATMDEARAEFEQIVKANMAALDTALDAIFEEYRQRADRVHESFVDRATHSLLDHLENYGPDEIWEYDPTGLRLLLRSAYSTMGNRVRKDALSRYEVAVSDAAHLFYRVFGSAVEGIQIPVPTAPPIPSPVALGQAIALDFNDSWWSNWWRRTVGYKAFARKFQNLIRAETEDFMTQMKEVQIADIRREVTEELRDFLDEQRSILLDLITGSAQRAGRVEDLFAGIEQRNADPALENTLVTLRRYAA
jgi:hypothetical protein